MFGRMMNNYYYGKSGKGDYRKEDLPSNRWQLFWEMLRVRLSGLMRLNLMYAVAWLPAMIVMMIYALGWYTNLGSILESFGEDLAGAQAAIDQMTVSMLMNAALWLIPCILITGPFTAGVAYVTRNWARDEHAFVWSDFKDAVKENWKQALGVSAITSLVPAMVILCWNFYGMMAQQMNMPILAAAQFLTLSMGLVWMLMLIYLYPLMVTYRLTFKQLLRNAVLLAIGRLPQSLGLRLATALPLIIGFLVAYFIGQAQWVVFILFLYYLIFGFALSRFAFASYSNGAFDRYINVNIEGVEINRGLNPDADEDEDEEYDEDEEE